MKKLLTLTIATLMATGCVTPTLADVTQQADANLQAGTLLDKDPSLCFDVSHHVKSVVNRSMMYEISLVDSVNAIEYLMPKTHKLTRLYAESLESAYMLKSKYGYDYRIAEFLGVKAKEWCYANDSKMKYFREDLENQKDLEELQ